MFSHLLARTPKHYRWLLIAGFAAFVIFELSRIAAVIAWLEPARNAFLHEFDRMTSFPWPLALLSASIAILVFVPPMALLAWGLRRLHVRLFHRGTAAG